MMIHSVYTMVSQWLLQKNVTVWDAKKKSKATGTVKSIGWVEGSKNPLRIHFHDGTECMASAHAMITDAADPIPEPQPEITTLREILKQHLKDKKIQVGHSFGRVADIEYTDAVLQDGYEKDAFFTLKYDDGDWINIFDIDTEIKILPDEKAQE